MTFTLWMLLWGLLMSAIFAVCGGWVVRLASDNTILGMVLGILLGWIILAVIV